MNKLIAVFVGLVLPFSAFANDVFPHEFKLELLDTKINVGTYAPRASDTGVVIYLHGYADTFNNHEHLLSQFHGAGMRVLAFDYPTHGKSEGSIWFWSIDQVGSLVRELLNHDTFRKGPLAVNRKLPVILVGWSTGATIALRTAQDWKSLVVPEDMRLAGVIGFAPGLPARAFVGDGFSRLGMKVKAEDLTRSPSALKYAPSPQTTVLGSGLFAGTLKGASEFAYYKGATDVPTLLLIADQEKDFFALADWSAYWVQSAGLNRPTYGFQCPGAYHGIEFEPDNIGELTQLLAIEFAQRAAQANPATARREIEASFRTRNNRTCPAVHVK